MCILCLHLLTSISAPGVEKFLKGGLRLWMYSKNLCSLLRSHATCEVKKEEENKQTAYKQKAVKTHCESCFKCHSGWKLLKRKIKCLFFFCSQKTQKNWIFFSSFRSWFIWKFFQLSLIGWIDVDKSRFSLFSGWI